MSFFSALTKCFKFLMPIRRHLKSTSMQCACSTYGGARPMWLFQYSRNNNKTYPFLQLDICAEQHVRLLSSSKTDLWLLWARKTNQRLEAHLHDCLDSNETDGRSKALELKNKNTHIATTSSLKEA